MSQRNRYQPAEASPADVLHVMGVGLTVEQTPAHELWALVQADGAARVRASAPAGSLQGCQDAADLFRAATLRSALRHRPAQGGAPRPFVENYPLPVSLALPERRRDLGDMSAWASRRIDALRHTLRNGAGLCFHDIASRSPIMLGADNDFLLRRAFERFDQAGDLNSLLLWAEDGYAARSELGGWESAQQESLQAILSRDKRRTDLSDTFAAVLLGRPEAAEWLQELAPHVRNSGSVRTHGNGVRSRTMHGFGGLGLEHRTAQANYRSPQVFTVMPHVPAPWSRAQMAQYDQMPSLAFLHRPQAVFYADDGAAPQTVPMAQRTARLQAALTAVVKGALRGRAPKRVFYDAGPVGSEGDKPALLARSLHGVLAGTHFVGNAHWIDLAQRLGDTGAAGAFASVALASMSAWETGEAALVVHLRRDAGATVLAVTPVSEAYRNRFRQRPYEAT